MIKYKWMDEGREGAKRERGNRETERCGTVAHVFSALMLERVGAITNEEDMGIH
jgi:hypothetical protein